ncbi:MAG: MipA/OmpV family protein [Moraxella sp.]|nr:MipA/OmpV family protein [Moraxella sp.]
MKKSVLPLVFVALVPLLSWADDALTVGALASFGSSKYAIDDKVSAVPLFLYDNDRFYIEGTEMGTYPLKNDTHWVRVGVSYDGTNFDPNDAKQPALRGLDKRKSSVNAHASYMRITPIGGFEAKATTDILDKSGGQTLSLAHRSRFKLNDNKLTIYPKFGLKWHSNDYNDYYYSVSNQESTRTGVSQYTAKSSISPFVSVSARYQLFDKVGLFANQQVEWLSSTQKNSPLTDDTIDTITNVGITYGF